MRRSLAGLVLILGIGAAAPASAQELIEPGARQGYYLGAGVRQSLMGARDDDFGDLGVQQGFGLALRFGQVVNEWFGFGLFIAGNGMASGDWGLGGGNLSLEAQFIPLRDYDLAIRGTVGIGAVGVSRREEEQATEDDPEGALGAYYTLGASYDLFPFYDKEAYESGGFSFAGFLELHLFPGDGILTGGLVIGLEVSYWFGFEKNRLDLPPEAAFEVED